MKRLKLFLPVIIFVVMAAFLYLGLGKDPTQLPSVTIGQKVPEFSLPTLDSDLSQMYADENMLGQPLLMNVWATWCFSCLQEHPFFVKLAEQGIGIVGINYKDESGPAKEWLKKHGNPYVVTVYDSTGRLGLTWVLPERQRRFL